MNIYLIKRKGNTPVDEYHGFVICAKTQQEAMNFANHVGKEGEYWPIDKEELEIVELGVCYADIKPGIVLDDFNKGGY